MNDIKNWLPEFRVAAESDRELLKYFFKTKIVDSTYNSHRWMILGRKGTGKTAIYEFLKSSKPEDTNGYFNIALSFKDYPWPIHKIYKESMEGELTSYQKSWHYLFTIQFIAKLIQIKEMNKEKLSAELKAVKNYIEQIYGNPNPSIIEVIKTKFKRLDKIKLPGIETDAISAHIGEISFEEISEDQILKNKLRSNAFNLLNYFQKILIDNIQPYKILISLDQLDENWLRTEMTEYAKILINLINVCQSINNSNKFNGSVKIVLFLRTDIFDTLVFNDKNKIFQDAAIEIRWDDESLNEMYFERIKSYKPRDVELDYSLKTNSIFEVKNVRHGATPFRHILRRSFYRPRDIIVFINNVRDIHQPSKTGLFTSKDIYQAEKAVSNNIFQELIDEWSNQKPDIEKYLKVLQNIGYQTFYIDDFVEKYNQQFDSVDIADINEALRFLFENSIIGQKVNVNWSYSCSKPGIQIDFDKPFHVNSGLKDRLVLTESRTTSSAQSLDLELKRLTLEEFNFDDFIESDEE